MNQNSMIHATNCAIIAIDEDDIDVKEAKDLKAKLDLRGKRVNAKFDDIMPDKSDDKHIAKAFTALITKMLVQYSPESRTWKDLVACWMPLKTQCPKTDHYHQKKQMCIHLEFLMLMKAQKRVL